jgi:chromosomal replication initiation ATPase DnaA
MSLKGEKGARVNNPYNPSFGQKPERFIGRDSIIFEILNALDNYNSPWRTSLLIGVRGSGKTALLTDLAESVKKNEVLIVSVTPDGQLLNDILSCLYDKMPKTLRSAFKRVSTVSIGNLSVTFGNDQSAPEFTKNFRYQITKMLEELKKKKYKVMFLLDESQKHSEEMRMFISTYQHLIRESFDVSLVMAVLPNVISDILNDNVLTFLRRAKQVTLENVAYSAVWQEYTEMIKKHFDVTDETIQEAAASTKGYPYLIQLVGYYLWEFLHRGENENVALQKCINESKIMMFQNVHKLLYRELSAGDKEFVKAMAVDEKVSSFSSILERTNRTKNHVSTYRIRLIDSGYIRGVGYGKLEFSIPYTREFIGEEMYY